VSEGLRRKIEQLGRGVLGLDYALCIDEEMVIDRVIMELRARHCFRQEQSIPLP
jgi:hypothetical protein